MEVFRKFRARSKSKGQTDALSVTESASQKQQRPSVWSKHNKLLSRTKTQTSEGGSTRGPDEFRRVIPSNETRDTSSSGRIQPVLVGISRPSMTLSRPDTSTSIQKAVDYAADLHSQPQPRSPPQPPRSSHSRTKSPKYIDIFAISGQTAIPTTTFNEAVAERNIESRTSEDRQGQYVPTSKFQEEVATRNLRSFEISRETPSALASHTADSRNASMRSNIRRPDSSLSGGYQEPRRLDLTEAEKAPEPPINQSRGRPSQDKERKKRLSTIPQEIQNEDKVASGTRSKNSDIRQEGLEEGKRRLLPRERARDIYATNTASVNPKLAAAAALYRGHNPRDHQNVIDSEKASQKSQKSSRRQHLSPDYLSDSRQKTYEQRYAASSLTSKSRTSEDPGEEPVYRTTSALSTTSSRRNQGAHGRTIMDLTGDDSDLISLRSTDYPHTPVIEDATADSYLKIKPAIIDANPRSPRQSRDVGSIINSFTGPSGMINETMQPGQNDLREVSATYVNDQTERVSPVSIYSDELPQASPPLTFSPISTLASTAPRTSVVITEPAETKITSVPTAPITLPKQETVSPRIDSKMLHPIREDESLSGETTPTQTPNIKAKDVSNDSTDGTLGDGISALDSDKLQASLVSTTNAQAHSPSSLAKFYVTENKDNLSYGSNSVDMHGIKSRDFAFTATNVAPQLPSKSPRRNLEDNKHQEEGPSTSVPLKISQDKISSPPALKNASPMRSTETSRVRQNSGAPRQPRPISVFDEEGFSKKKEEMKALLVRLQQSLNEELPPLTDITATNYENARNATPDLQGGMNGMSPTLVAKEHQRDGSMNKSMQTSAQGSENRPLPPRTRSLPKSERSTTANGGIYSNNDRPATVASATRSPTKRELTYPRTKYGVRGSTQTRTSIPPEKMDLTSSYMSPMLSRSEFEDAPPHSPGEVSLSSFPLPVTDSSSEAYLRNSNGSGTMQIPETAPILVRRGSQASKMSSASQHSIPYHMVPGRGSSLRDQIKEEQGHMQWE